MNTSFPLYKDNSRVRYKSCIARDFTSMHEMTQITPLLRTTVL